MGPDRIASVITELSGRRSQNCYLVLYHAIQVAIKYTPEEPQMKVICSEVMIRLKKKSPAAVSKALSRAADDIWQYGNRKLLEEIYRGPIYEPPAPKDLIYRLTDYLGRSVEYCMKLDPFLQGYSILAKQSTREWIIAAILNKDQDSICHLVDSLNQAQTSLEQFRHTLLSGDISSLLK